MNKLHDGRRIVDRYMEEVRELIPVDVDIEDLVTLAEAARILGVSIQAVAGAVDRGFYDTVIIDTEVMVKRGSKGRRLLLRGEVLERVYPTLPSQEPRPRTGTGLGYGTGAGGVYARVG